MAWVDPTQLAILAVLTILSIFVFHRFPSSSRPPAIFTPPEGNNLSDGMTYCIRGVPIAWDKDQLESFLVAHDGSHIPGIKSLAIEAHGRSQTGTVTSHRGRPLPKTLQGSLQPGGEITKLKLDTDFLGLSTLFSPPPGEHQVDILAISGLGGHAFGSFKERNGQHMWLRDALPHHLLAEHSGRPMARVMTYGYESAVANSSSMQNLEDLATSFRESLNTIISSQAPRPLILVAHSLGGLIVKQTLITLAKSKEEDHQKIIRAVYGIVFFGVPHDGMDVGSLIPMVGDGPNRELIGSISRINSQILSIQQRDFHQALGPEGHTEVFCFYETTESPTALQKDENGRWRMTGPKAVLVAKSSATHCRPWEDGPEHICAINRSHSDMVKFGQEDHEYEHTLQRLRGLANRALSVQHRLRDNNTKFLVPYNRNPDYVGRSLILEKIKEQFGYSKSQAARQPRVSLFGLGGVGKTQIALALTYWIYDNLLDTSVFWIHASSADRFRQAFTSIAEECQVPGWDDPKSDVPLLVRRWLEKRERGRWAMVIDNADNSEVFFPSKPEQADAAAANSATTSNRLSDYIPDCTHGSILITTRDKKTAVKFLQGKSPLVEVDKMSESEAGQLLHKTLGDGISAEEAACLSARLEYLPLAIAQAGAFIQENSISTNEYLQILDENEDTIVEQLNEPFETVGRDSDTPNAVTATWIVSFNQIQRQDILAGKILSFISLLDRQAIPKSFIMSYCDERCKSVQATSVAGVTKALGTLKAFSLVAEAKDNTIDMHRLVQLVTRKWLVMQNKFAKFAECALETVSKAYPYGCHETRQTCVDYLPHAIAVIRNNGTGLYSEKVNRATLLLCMTGFFLSSGQWDEAERSASQCFDIQKEIFGEEDPEILISMANLALTYRKQGRWEEAEKLEVEVMETSKQKLGPAHPSTLTSMANLASTYRKQGRWEEAEKLNVEVIETRKQKLGPAHPSILNSIANLASTYRKQGRWEEAEKLEVEVMETHKQKLGPAHPDTLTSMANLALTYRKQGRWEEAEKLNVEVMETRKQKLGPAHPSILNSMANLASLYRKQGRWEEAEKLEVEVMETRKQKLGPAHPSTLTSMANLALTYRKQGRWEEAEKLNVEVIETRKQKLGPAHPDTITSMANLASTYRRQGRWEEAEKLEVEVMEISKQKLGPAHPSTLSRMANLASTFWSQGRWEEAEKLEVEVMETRKQKLGPAHPDTITSMANLASTYQNQGRWEEAEKLEVEVMETRKQRLGPAHPSTLTSMANLASTYRNQGRWEEAEKLEVEVMEMSKQKLGPAHPDTLTSMANLASTFWNQGRWEEAEKLEVEVMETRKQKLGPAHPSTLTSMANLAFTWYSQKRITDALDLMDSCVQIRLEVLGREHPDTSSSIETLENWHAEQVIPLLTDLDLSGND